MFISAFRISLILTAVFVVEMSNASCKAAIRQCERTCLRTVLTVDGQEVQGVRTDFSIKCEEACQAGITKCDVYEPATPTRCSDFRDVCKRFCPDSVFVHVNLQGMKVGYSMQSNVTAACANACESGYNLCR